jgi:hypothetical protein
MLGWTLAASPVSSRSKTEPRDCRDSCSAAAFGARSPGTDTPSRPKRPRRAGSSPRTSAVHGRGRAAVRRSRHRLLLVFWIGGCARGASRSAERAAAARCAREGHVSADRRGLRAVDAGAAHGLRVRHQPVRPASEHKTILSCIAWVLFGVLLIGRMRYGWRGRFAVRWTLERIRHADPRLFRIEIRARVSARAALGLSGKPRCKHFSLGVLFCGAGGVAAAGGILRRQRNGAHEPEPLPARHRAKAGHRGARLAEALLARPDRLIGLILLLSTVVNV